MPHHHYNNGLIGGGLDNALELISVPTRPTDNRFSGKSAKGCKGVAAAAGLRVRQSQGEEECDLVKETMTDFGVVMCAR